MAIWTYGGEVRDKDAIRAAIDRKSCVFCKAKLKPPSHEHSVIERGPGNTGTSAGLWVNCCSVCGWWTAYRRVDTNFGGRLSTAEYGATGSLRELDLSDQSLPVEEIRAYLAAKYDARFKIDPWKFEETVASVYKDLGYQARVTARSGDDGIDVILDGPDNIVVGVQVKRYKGKISVEQIRSLAGSLILGGITRGIFVTTSTFQSGAQPTAQKYRLRGIPIELVDAERFYEALGIAQRKAYESSSDKTAPFTDAELKYLGSYSFRHGVP